MLPKENRQGLREILVIFARFRLFSPVFDSLEDDLTQSKPEPSDGNNNLDKLEKFPHTITGCHSGEQVRRTVLVVVLVKLFKAKPSRWYVPALHIFTYNPVS